MEGATNTMGAILDTVQTFFTQIVAWVGDLIDLVVSQPLLLLLCICLPVAGYVVGFLRRLISL